MNRRDLFKKAPIAAMAVAGLGLTATPTVSEEPSNTKTVRVPTPCYNSIRLWKLGDLDKELFPTSQAIQKLADILKSNPNNGEPFDIIWGPELTCEVINTQGAPCDVIDIGRPTPEEIADATISEMLKTSAIDQGSRDWIRQAVIDGVKKASKGAIDEQGT